MKRIKKDKEKVYFVQFAHYAKKRIFFMLFAQYANFKKKNQNSVQFKAKNDILLKCGLRRYEREKSCEIEARQISSLSIIISYHHRHHFTLFKNW